MDLDTAPAAEDASGPEGAGARQRESRCDFSLGALLIIVHTLQCSDFLLFCEDGMVLRFGDTRSKNRRLELCALLFSLGKQATVYRRLLFWLVSRMGGKEDRHGRDVCLGSA